MNTKEISKILKIIAALIVCVLLIDFCVGCIFDSLLDKLPSEGERVAKSNYVITKVKSDVVIIGSSRAECHYDSKLIQDSMQGKTIFNCGVDGQLFFYEVAVLNSILDRYTPYLIIWDIQNDELMQTNQPENLGLLYPYYKKIESVRKFMNERDPLLKYMIWLNAYRYNATGSRILRSLNLHDSNLMGFIGRQSSDNTRIIEHKTIRQTETPLDKDKIELFKRAIDRAKTKGTRLVIVQSPYYYKFDGESSTIKMVKEICSERGGQFIDDSQLPVFVGNNNLIYDAGHLRIEGARIFTEILLEQLRSEDNDDLLSVE